MYIKSPPSCGCTQFQIVNMAYSKNLFSITLVLIAASVYFSNAAIPIRTRIVGGQHAVKGQFPYMALFVDRDTKLPVGSGAIVGKHHIVTSAFGLSAYQWKPQQLITVLGAWKIGEYETTSDIYEVILHPFFKSNLSSFDVAVIKTVDEIVFNEFIQPVLLPEVDLVNGGEKVVVSGFGHTGVRFAFFVVG